MKEREDLVFSSCRTTTENQRKVEALEIELEDASKAAFDMEVKVLENEAKVAMLLGDQANCLNLKRKQLEKSSQLGAARVVL